jgi:hypothetical protein
MAQEGCQEEEARHPKQKEGPDQQVLHQCVPLFPHCVPWLWFTVVRISMMA